MADETNRRFFRALRRFILDAQDADPNPIDSDIVLTYDHECNEVLAIRGDNTETANSSSPPDGGSGGGTSYPP